MNPKAKLRRIADVLWFEHLIKKNPYCELCNKPADQIHHFFSKHNYSHLRYDFKNGISLCKYHHFRLHHQDPVMITQEIIRKRGKKWYNALEKRARNRPQGSWKTIGYYKKTINKLEKLCQEKN